MKYFFLLSLSALMLWSCGNKNQFSISGKVVPAVDGKIILIGFKDGQPVPVDTVEIAKGKFAFKGEVEMPELKLLVIEGEKSPVAQLFIEPGKIDMTVYPDSFETNVIKGSKSQDIFQKFMDEMITFSTKESGLKMRAQTAQATGNEEEMGAIQYEYQTMVENIQLFSRNFIKEYKSSPVAAYVYLMNFIQEAQYEELDSMLTVFEPIKSSEFVAAIQERAEAMKPFSKGAQAPDFTLAGPDGKTFTLSSLKGKYVLIDFWASWCKPCMIELPNVIEQYAAYKDKGFEIVGVSLDREKDAWLNTIKIPGMSWIHVWDMEGETPGNVANMFGVTGIPHTVLLDKEGKILGTNLRGEALKSKLAELM
jgi:peroxiredoxin